MENKYYKKLVLVSPSFDSEITTLCFELNKLKHSRFVGTTIPEMFHELKHVFHLLESIASSRIEGNNTTVSEFFEIADEENIKEDENFRGIDNISKGLDFIVENNVIPMNKTFVSQLHSLVVRGLSKPPAGEGDKTPGMYRNYGVSIKRSNHTPPRTMSEIEEYMEELFKFLEKKDSVNYDLLKIAIATHRFLWIHPFGNGNGRVARLFSYALLNKYGYGARIFLHPASSFCVNRTNYYDSLSKADSGEKENVLEWCEFFLSNLKVEVNKVLHLTNIKYVKNKIILPALDNLYNNGIINALELSILKLASEKQRIQNSDIRSNLTKISTVYVSKVIRELREKKLLRTCKDFKQKYYLSFIQNKMTKFIIIQLKKENFIPKELDENPANQGK